MKTKIETHLLTFQNTSQQHTLYYEFDLLGEVKNRLNDLKHETIFMGLVYILSCIVFYEVHQNGA